MSTERTRRWIRPAVSELAAYAVADASGMVKLDAMENPYGLPDQLRESWCDELAHIDMNRYPDPSSRELKGLMYEVLGLPEQAALLLGNGSDEIIQMLAMAFGGEGRIFMSMDPAFVMYRMIALMNGMRYISADLQPDSFSFDMASSLATIEAEQPAVVFVANPNNPTGNSHSLDDLRRLAEAVPGVLVVDEAYAPFTDTTALPLLEEYTHVLVMRTFSKMGLAGLRLGYLLGDPQWINELDKVRLPYNINVFSQRAAAFALDHYATFEQQATQIRSDRQGLFESLGGMPGVKVWPSEANFLLFRGPEDSGVSIYQSLKDRGILIKSLSGGHPSLQDCLRVTVGTPAENQQFLASLADILSGQDYR